MSKTIFSWVMHLTINDEEMARNLVNFLDLAKDLHLDMDKIREVVEAKYKKGEVQSR